MSLHSQRVSTPFHANGTPRSPTFVASTWSRFAGSLLVARATASASASRTAVVRARGLACSSSSTDSSRSYVAFTREP